MKARFAFLTLTALAFNCAPTEADPVRVPATKNGPREVAIVGAGCFWGVETWMEKASGVVAIDVGYAGGKARGVTYEQVSGGNTGHAEAVRITFDPSIISYEQLLTRFFLIHDPTTLNRQGNDAGTQYRSAIFPTSDVQLQIAERVKARVVKSNAWKKPITTTIETNATWVRAEDYHQDYLVKHPGGYDNHFLRDLSF
ncbi:MAG: peptide-methionine (S)-S-oxide reductase MsrA [Kofleriaceae bacterium]